MWTAVFRQGCYSCILGGRTNMSEHQRYPHLNRYDRSDRHNNRTRPNSPERKHDRLITRDMALVMLATFFFMSSNMLDHSDHCRLCESMGATGVLMGAIAGVDEFRVTVLPPYRRQSFGLNQQEVAGGGGNGAVFRGGRHVLSRQFDGHAGRGAHGQRLGFACGTVCLATWVSLLLPIRHMGAGMGLYGT